MTLKKIVPYIPALLLVSLLAIPSVADAQKTITGSDLDKLRVPIFNFQGVNGALDLMARLIQLLLLVAGVVAFFYVLWGGFQYLTAGPDGKGADTGRKTIINAVIGIIIIAISYSLVSFVIGILNRESQAAPAAGSAGTSQQRTGSTVESRTGTGTSTTATGNNALKGTVTLNGTPVSGSYELRSGATPVKSGSFSGGAYLITGIPAGTYQLFFSDNGSAVYDGQISFTTSSDPVRSLDIQLVPTRDD